MYTQSDQLPVTSQFRLFFLLTNDEELTLPEGTLYSNTALTIAVPVLKRLFLWKETVLIQEHSASSPISLFLPCLSAQR